MPPGAIVGIIGPNGAGKSTLFRMITGKEKPDAGKIAIGTTVKLAHVDQSRDDARRATRPCSRTSPAGSDILKVGKFEMPSRAYLGRFNFKGADQQKKVGQLSGGERGRLHLAKTLLSGGNVLLLDEPSNDLDVETLRALEEALLEFAGSVLVISHDRWFLDRIATHILAFEGDSQVVFFDGNYQEYEADKRKRLGEEAAQAATHPLQAAEVAARGGGAAVGLLGARRAARASAAAGASTPADGGPNGGLLLGARPALATLRATSAGRRPAPRASDALRAPRASTSREAQHCASARRRARAAPSRAPSSTPRCRRLAPPRQARAPGTPPGRRA